MTHSKFRLPPLIQNQSFFTDNFFIYFRDECIQYLHFKATAAVGTERNQ